MNRYDLSNGDSVKVPVQHGDVIFMDWEWHFASYINEEVHCTGLSETERFESIKSFCYAAKDQEAGFMAIVESDSPINGQDGLLEATKGLKVSLEEPTEAGTSHRQQSKRNAKGKQTKKEFGSHELQES